MKIFKINLSIKDYIFILIVLAACSVTVYQKVIHRNDELGAGEQWAKVKIGNAQLSVFIADTDDEKYEGLSDVEEIDSDQGMLFVHDSLGRYPYVMRGMLFDLDFIFINGDKVVDIAKNVAHEYSGTIVGAADYDKVLEVNAEWARYNNIKIGQNVSIE